MKIKRVPPSPAPGLRRNELIVGNTYIDADDPDDHDVYMAIEIHGDSTKMMLNLTSGLVFAGDKLRWVPVDAEVLVK